TDVTGAVTLPEGVEMVMPGDNVKMVGSLIHPIAMDEGLRVAIREGGRTVGAGVVAKVVKSFTAWTGIPRPAAPDALRVRRPWPAIPLRCRGVRSVPPHTA